MPDTIEDDEPPAEQEAPEPRAVGRRLAWFFGIAAVSGLAFAGAAEILRWLILH